MGDPSQECREGGAARQTPFMSNLPFQSDPAFATRRALLGSIREHLLKSRRLLLASAPSRPGTQCPTDFAVELACLCRDDFDGIWWVPGGCTAALPGLFAEIAIALRLPEAESLEQERMVMAVRRHLVRAPRTLIIFDQVTDLKSVNALVPDRVPGCVLVTSAEALSGAPLATLEVSDFHPAESREFLAARLGTPLTAQDDETAFHLGGVPLLLHLYAGCVALEPARRAALREAAERLCDTHAHDDRARIRALLEHLLREVLSVLREREHLAFNLYALAAFMGPQPLYANVFQDGVTHLPEVLSKALADPRVLPRLLGVLRRAGLARTGRAAVSLPAVLQERFVSSLPGEAKEAGCRAALRFVVNMFPFKEEHQTFNLQCSRLLGHASVAATWAEVMGSSLEDAGRLLNQLGLYLRACDQREEAVKYYLHAVACGEAVDGENHPKVAVRINNLGVVYRETGRLDEARHAFRRALRIIRAAYGPADPMLAMAMRNLIAVAEDSKDEREMERAYRRALRIYADSLGQAHPYVHQCLSSLGRILRKRDDVEGAKRCLDEALRCAMLCSPPDDEAIALYARHLGRLLLRSGDAGGALERLQTAVTLCRKLHGDSSLPLAETLYELGHAQRQVKQLSEARASLEEALRISQSLRANEELQGRILSQLARVQRVQGDVPGAAVCYQQVCRIQEAIGGAQNPELVASLTDLGNCLEQAGKPHDAEACYLRALELEKTVNTGDIGLGTLQYRIGAVKRALGDYTQALEFLKLAISADMRASGSRHPDVARDLLGLGLVYNDLGDSSQAVGNLMRALAIYEEQLGRYHAQTIEARNVLETLGSGEP